jgi:hypothetical protein
MAIFTVGVFLVLYVVLSTGASIYLHEKEHGVVNWLQCCLAFFLPLNSLICVWEISLFINIDHIKAEYTKLKRNFKGKELEACANFFTAPLSLSNLFSLKYWSNVWSTYALYDPSYSNKESFGFFVDVSNGFSFLLPSLLYLYAMTYDISTYMSARALGLMGLVKFYVEFHGTCVYFLSFFFNRRYKGFSNFEVGLFVGFSNGLWFVFPLLGCYASYYLIESNSFAVLR